MARRHRHNDRRLPHRNGTNSVNKSDPSQRPLLPGHGYQLLHLPLGHPLVMLIIQMIDGPLPFPGANKPRKSHKRPRPIIITGASRRVVTKATHDIIQTNGIASYGNNITTTHQDPPQNSNNRQRHKGPEEDKKPFSSGDAHQFHPMGPCRPRHLDGR